MSNNNPLFLFFFVLLKKKFFSVIQCVLFVTKQKRIKKANEDKLVTVANRHGDISGKLRRQFLCAFIELEYLSVPYCCLTVCLVSLCFYNFFKKNSFAFVVIV